MEKLRRPGALRAGGAAHGHTALGPRSVVEERINAVCEHEACSVHHFCIVEELQRILDSYSSTGSDQFKRRHMMVRDVSSN